MGIPGAGKTRLAEEYVARGYLRLNRDERGGSLRELAAALDEALASGHARVVLDNTYLTRASRSYVVETANRHGVAARCVWLDTPLAQAQVNLVERILDRVGALPTPEELRALAREAGILAPTSQMRTVRELEPPSADEGFASVEPVPFAARAVDRRARRRLRRGRRATPLGGRARRRTGRTGPPLRLEAGRSRRGAGTRWPPASRPHVSPGRGRDLRARRRPAGVLVPATAAGAPARVRPRPRRRPFTLAARRNRRRRIARSRTPSARDTSACRRAVSQV